MTEYDVVVVGGRVAGASTALLLARAGAPRRAARAGGRTAATPSSTHGLMRAGRPPAVRAGACSTGGRRRHAAGPRTMFHYGDGRQRVSIRPQRRGRRALRAAADRARPAPRRRRREAGADVFAATTVTDLLRDTDGRVRASGSRRTRRARTGRSGRGITVGADGIRSIVAASSRGADVLRRGATASAVLYRYVADLPADGYEWAYGDARRRRADPHQRRGDLRLRRAPPPPRMRTLRRAGAEQAFATLLAAAAPALADRVARRAAGARLHGWAGAPGFVRQSGGRAGRWSGTPATSRTRSPRTASPTRCATPSCWPTRCSTRSPVRVPEAGRAGGYQATRDRLSSRLFDATEAVAALRLGQPTSSRRCCGRSARR